VARLDLPLNLHGNAHHPFYPELRSLRAAAKATAERFALTNVHSD
jgi:hypothetical protein